MPTGDRICHGPCDQGRKPCQTPDACELIEQAEDADELGAARGIVLAVGVVAAVIACVSLIVGAI